MEDGANVVSGLLQSPSSAHQQQHCPAIAKLMQGQRGVGTVGGVLQTVSESPENRLCDNGVPLEHHHHHHHLYHHQQQHHHHQHQLHPDPIRRLFQTQPPPLPTTSFSSAAPNCCSNPSSLQQNPHLSPQPVMVNSVSRSHLQAQQSQQLFISLSNSQPEIQQNSQTAPAAQGTGGKIFCVKCSQTNKLTNTYIFIITMLINYGKNNFSIVLMGFSLLYQVCCHLR